MPSVRECHVKTGKSRKDAREKEEHFLGRVLVSLSPTNSCTWLNSRTAATLGLNGRARPWVRCVLKACLDFDVAVKLFMAM